MEDIFYKEKKEEEEKKRFFIFNCLVVSVRLCSQFIQDNVIVEDYDSSGWWETRILRILVFLLCSTDRNNHYIISFK